MTDQEITNVDLMAKMVEIHKDVQAGFERVDSELQAVRSVVDNELAGQGQVMELEGAVRELRRDVKKLSKAVAPSR